jgi:hypothetical protein
MKKYFKCIPLLFISLMTSCSNENTSFDSGSDEGQQAKSLNLLIVDTVEIHDFDEDFEDFLQIDNLMLDSSREAYVDIDANELYIPILEGYVFNSNLKTNNDEFPKVEIGAGIKYKVARKKPRSNPNRCQGDCKCGVGFRCGNDKYVYLKPKSVEQFNLEDRLASGQILIDVVNHYYVVEFDTIGIDWLFLDNE